VAFQGFGHSPLEAEEGFEGAGEGFEGGFGLEGSSAEEGRWRGFLSLRRLLRPVGLG